MAAISIHAPLAGRDYFGTQTEKRKNISIHAPLAGRDEALQSLVDVINGISIHAPLAGRDSHFSVAFVDDSTFQSTRPLRGATACALETP